MCFNASGVFFASNLHVEMGRPLYDREDPHIWYFYNSGEVFVQPFGDNSFPKQNEKYVLKWRP